MILEIPLRSDKYPHYEFSVSLEDSEYTFTIKYNERESVFYYDVSVTSTQEKIITGARVNNSRRIYGGRTVVRDKAFLGELYLIDESTQNDPGLDNLGITAKIMYIYE